MIERAIFQAKRLLHAFGHPARAPEIAALKVDLVRERLGLREAIAKYLEHDDFANLIKRVKTPEDKTDAA